MALGDDRRFSRRRGRILGHIVALRRSQAVAASATEEGPLPEGPLETSAGEGGEGADRSEMDRLQRRVDHLEASLEGLQDALHRESERRDREIAALERQLRPDTMARSLSDDARRRGI